MSSNSTTPAERPTPLPHKSALILPYKHQMLQHAAIQSQYCYMFLNGH